MTDYYTCRDCQGYVLTCGCLEAKQAANMAKRQRREASKTCAWVAVFQTIVGTCARNLPDACHETDAVNKARALPVGRGHRLLRVEKTITETIWNHDDPPASD